MAAEAAQHFVERVEFLVDEVLQRGNSAGAVTRAGSGVAMA
jgi:hypothetical protein